jgi:Cu/Ag efflux protein CusF
MNRRLKECWASAAVVVLLGGCGESTTTAETMSDAMPNMPSSSTETEHSATGIVNSIDRTAGTINISHEPVPSADWPSMTMGFRLADSASTEGISAEQRIEFKFTLEDGGTVTMIEPAR